MSEREALEIKRSIRRGLNLATRAGTITPHDVATILVVLLTEQIAAEPTSVQAELLGVVRSNLDAAIAYVRGEPAGDAFPAAAETIGKFRQ